ncbi:MAG: cofactor-independent phosphoglycerate mutase [Euryarchaeota archaeon]|nr:cofactor-independent phosphoglycerate mutase [Euryarchaeota archaeon]
MKYIVILGDGMGDYPQPSLGGKTPLQAANTPNMDLLAREGRCGLARTTPAGMEPGSDVANLSILGYNPAEVYTGRAPLEAAAQGIQLGPQDVAYRCNLVTIENGVMKDYSAGHITSGEGAPLMQAVGAKLGAPGIEFHPGVSYRNLLVQRPGKVVDCTPPHNISGKPIEGRLPPDAHLKKLMLDSPPILADHPVNQKRRKAGKNPATMIWFWGGGTRPRLESFQEKYGVRGSVITAVDLLRGIGVYAGFTVVRVPGATGYLDTNFEGKAEHAIQTLRDHDFLFLHVEAVDEAGHEGDLDHKLQALEMLDKRTIGRLLDLLPDLGEPVRILLTTDHYTPIARKAHTPEPVPFALWGAGVERDGVKTFDEASVKQGGLGLVEATRLMDLLIRGGA